MKILKSSSNHITAEELFDKDIVVEFLNDVLYSIKQQFGVNLDIEQAEFDTPNSLYLEFGNDDWFIQYMLNIDMRRIKRPLDLWKYQSTVEKAIINEIERMR